ncbi:MAG: two-component regulator propeller domain-containing protein [Polaribacter sp.]|nr:two-component regulator propeller domain-containing protein [Polaribacter sp.]MDG1953328.1 two-component regulator propeller domain-containing protein [Polaribacter sp.]
MRKLMQLLFNQLKKLLLFFAILFFVQVCSQELSPINIYSQKDYKAESQNWSISQSKEGSLYVANNKGLLEYNGASWQLYPTPNQTILRSVKSIEDKVYTGFYMDFGFWKRNEYGRLVYTSIVNDNDIPLLEDEQFWNIIELDEWILFQSLQRIHLYNPKSKAYKIINSDVKITKMYKVNNVIYFQKLGKGIYKIENGFSKIVSGNSIFKENEIIDIYEKENSLLVLTNSKGFYFLDDDEIRPWNISANKYLLNKTIYSSLRIVGKGFVIGTISNGVLFLNDKGELNNLITRKNGLNNNTVLTIFEDSNNVIWFGHDNGISNIDINSPIKIYKEREGHLGTVYASILYNENLYLGTNQGLFVKKNNSNKNFKLIKGTEGQVWFLKEIDNQLFCGHDLGTIIINDNEITTKINIQGAWDIKPIGNGELLQGNYSGLFVLEKNKGSWKVKNKISGFNNSSKSFELYKNNQVFVNHEYKGVFKLKIDKNFEKVLKVEKDSSINIGKHSSLIKYDNKILYSFEEGVYVYNDVDKKFKKDSIFSKLYSDENYNTGKFVLNKRNNLLWSFSKKNISYIKPSNLVKKVTIQKLPISEILRKGAIGYENIYEVSNNQYLLGINNGYLSINIKDNDKYRNEQYKVSINSIKKNKLNEQQEDVALNDTGNFIFRENNIKFEYGTPFLTQNSYIEYQYLLEGYTSNWSEWSTKSTASFENLPVGNEYTFYVRAKIGNDLTKNTASYIFVINNPWYQTDLAIASYVLLLLLLLFLIDRIYKRYYRGQRKKLLEKQEKDFKIKSLATEKELIQAKNEQLNIDIKSKSRELASSTMSIIKKNELLSSIKNELREDKNINNVIRIIDKNINNTDDWQIFKVAFNNADKDFIKKLKSLHNALTPNDLRLCAYLRLNLSSKEIAPLLNISYKSVEVKRYRLRKKINLKHNDSLTDYILKI